MMEQTALVCARAADVDQWPVRQGTAQPFGKFGDIVVEIFDVALLARIAHSDDAPLPADPHQAVDIDVAPRRDHLRLARIAERDRDQRAETIDRDVGEEHVACPVDCGRGEAAKGRPAERDAVQHLPLRTALAPEHVDPLARGVAVAVEQLARLEADRAVFVGEVKDRAVVGPFLELAPSALDIDPFDPETLFAACGARHEVVLLDPFARHQDLPRLARHVERDDVAAVLHEARRAKALPLGKLLRVRAVVVDREHPGVGQQQSVPRPRRAV